MAEEPNKRMDRMLRGYAEKRRESGEVRMHPATRQMLQAEVRQVHRSRSSENQGWRAWWPQIAFGCALFL